MIATIQLFEGTAVVCCHRIEFYYEWDDLELTDELKERLQGEAEDRARHDIGKDCCIGDLNCLYHDDEIVPDGIEIHGRWNIKSD